MPENKVDIKAVTWNVGNSGANASAVAAIKKNVAGGDVIVVGTQEEQVLSSKRNIFSSTLIAATTGITGVSSPDLASNRLDSLLVTALNADNPDLSRPYRLVTYVREASLAGDGAANRIQGKGQQQTRTSVIVRELYVLEDINTSSIKDSKNSNKAICNIQGTLKRKTNTGTIDIMPINLASGHLESYGEGQRREHTQNWVNQTVNSNASDTPDFEQIVRMGKQFNLMEGDLNMRDHAMKDGSSRDPGNSSALSGSGFDIGAHSTTSDGSTAHGTYSVVRGSNGEQVNAPDPKMVKHYEKKNKAGKRAGVNKGGHLDRIAVNVGRTYTSGDYITVRGKEGDRKRKEKKEVLQNFILAQIMLL